jgi:trk system potassium uptake protein TrkH
VDFAYKFFVSSFLCARGHGRFYIGRSKGDACAYFGKNVRNVLRNRLHPNAVNPVRLNGKPVSNEVIYNVMTLFFVYCFTLVVSTFLLILGGVSASESLGAVVASLTGYGPGLGCSGGFGNYAHFSVFVKWGLAFCMFAGRLECITVYMLFLPKFWKK